MFPNLRLISGAAIATMLLVMIMGSGLFSFRDPYSGVADIPDVRRPLVQRAIVTNPERQHIQFLAYARRSDELQRLLELPTSPAPTSPPPVTASYPFDVKATADDRPAAPADQPVAAGTPQGDGPAPASTPDAAVASLPSAAPAPGAQANTSAAAAPGAIAPESTAPDAAAPQAAVPQAAAVGQPSDRPRTTTPETASVAPAPQNRDTSLDPAGTPASATSTVAALTQAPEEPNAADEDAQSVPESPIPAIEHAPLPRADPRTADARDDVSASTNRVTLHRTTRVRPRRVIRTVRIQPPRTTGAPPSPAAVGSQQPQPNPLDGNPFDYRNSSGPMP